MLLPAGLSPLARGKRNLARPNELDRGPIPAGAGETDAALPWARKSWAYPRWRGGNAAPRSSACWPWGLSPLARGKHCRPGLPSPADGPIPAGAGETAAAKARCCARWAYPRWRGGNALSADHSPRRRGLSPLARGKRAEATIKSPLMGPIPAGAGETRAVRGLNVSSWAYPRWRGGNPLCRMGRPAPQGLSPLARGKR